MINIIKIRTGFCWKYAYLSTSPTCYFFTMLNIYCHNFLLLEMNDCISCKLCGIVLIIVLNLVLIWRALQNSSLFSFTFTSKLLHKWLFRFLFYGSLWRNRKSSFTIFSSKEFRFLSVNQISVIKFYLDKLWLTYCCFRHFWSIFFYHLLKIGIDV